MNTAVFLLSGAILAYEVVLMRMFSIAQWHHFASMILSIALLGFGLSGTLLALWRERLRGGFKLCAAGFVITAPLCTWLAQQIPFTPMLIVWQPRQLIFLFGIYLLLVVPFTLGALAIALALARARQLGAVGRTYAANLVGSGIGAVAGLALCFLPLPVQMSQYKGLEKALSMAEARILKTDFHPLGRVDVLHCPALRVAPGLSLGYTGWMPTQQVIFVDGEGGSALNLATAEDAAMEYVQWLPSAAAYAVRPAGRVLVIGVGGGAELHLAARQGAQELIGVEMHPVVAHLAAQNAPWADVRVAEGRAFIRQTTNRFDLIQISLLDSLATSATGVGAANESYLYTVEALGEFIARLSEDGVLCVTRWLKTPPRDNVKLFATAVEALERMGAVEPAGQLMFVRGWATGTLLVKRTLFTDEEIARARRWAEERGFDVDYFPGAAERDVNLRNVMAAPEYFQAARSVLFGDREEFFRDHLFNVRPATDERPYFFHFFRWMSAPHLLRTMGKEWVPFVEWGYIVLVATLLQAVLASVVLIVLPLRSAVGGSRLTVFVYFACLGLGFMLLEIALLQKFILFLGHPLYSAAVVIATFLVFAGAGSTQAGRRVRSAGRPATVIALIAVGCAAGLSPLLNVFLAAQESVRVLLAVLLVAPPAFFMGMMFPLGLGKITPRMLPWAWGVNGCFSVIGAALASVLAMDFGFSAVMLTSAALYACAGAVFARLR